MGDNTIPKERFAYTTVSRDKEETGFFICNSIDYRIEGINLVIIE